ncbi:tryptophan-rich sensory protein [Aminobacter sp. UC22_36]
MTERNAILSFVKTVAKTNRVAAWLLVPYPARLAFATLLDASI